MGGQLVLVAVVCSVIITTCAACPKESCNFPFGVAIECSKRYQLGEDVFCQVYITNQRNVDYYLLRTDTPLDNDMVSATSLSVTRYREKLYYDGWLVSRIPDSEPSSDEYVLVKAGSTVTAKVDLSNNFAMNKTGMYWVQLRTIFQYFQATDSQHQALSGEVSSLPTSFRLVGSGFPKLTVGQINRYKPELIKVKQAAGAPRDPAFEDATAAQETNMKEIHRAAYLYIKTALIDIADNRPHYEQWFGAYDAGRYNTVRDTFDGMRSALEIDVYTYNFSSVGSACNDPHRPNIYGYTSFGSRTIWFCDHFGTFQNVIGDYSKLHGLVHELQHTVIDRTRREVYGRQNCLNLAINDPGYAIVNADNYGFYAATLNVFDYGFDSMVVWSNDRVYVTRGNVYIRYSDSSASSIDSGYPALIRGSWGNLPDTFNAGFDSMIRFGSYNYVTKGDQYVRYSTGSPDSGYPAPLQGYWGNLPASFAAGFDSMEKLENGKTYITKGNEYIRSSDDGNTVDSGYPVSLQGNWGSLPSSFAAGFDSMALLGNGRVYVTKGKEYIRYSDGSASSIDPGYPAPIKGNWGSLP